MSDWIKHDGKGCPVDGDVLVLIQYRDGGIDADVAVYFSLRNFWKHKNSGFDIIAYQVITPYNPTED